MKQLDISGQYSKIDLDLIFFDATRVYLFMQMLLNKHVELFTNNAKISKNETKIS